MVPIVQRASRFFSTQTPRTSHYKKASGFPHTLSFLSDAINHCFLSTNPSNSLNLVHAHLIKLGFNSYAFLGNRCVDLYFKSGSTHDSINTFHDITYKDIVSWNLYLKILVKCVNVETARQVFDIMPARDSVSWNTIISGYISSGNSYHAWEIFAQMQNDGIRPTGYTFSILLSSANCAGYVKQMHCYLVRNCADNVSLVVWNSLIDVYGRIGLVDYAIAVFFFMEKVDVISWNSLISVCCQAGYDRFGLDQFYVMERLGYRPDGHTLSAVLHACSNLRNLEKGKQIVCLCVKMGFLRNTIVSSAAIDMFSKCNRVVDATYVFENLHVLDSALSNSMIACYASHYMEEKALELFVLSFRQNIRPTEFTLSCILSSSTALYPIVPGIQFHSLVIKLGFELDPIVASSLVEMYSKYGLIDCAVSVFQKMSVTDLITWNTMLLGFTNHGKLAEAICLFYKLLESGLLPDHITYTAVLLACCHGGFVEQGMAIFSSMTNQYGIKPVNEHYACVAVMMNQYGETGEAIALLQEIHCEPDTRICESVLHACGDSGDLELIEKLAERMMELDAHSLLPYMILADAYEKKGKWESVVRVRKEMKKVRRKNESGCSWIGIQGCVFPFEGSQIVHHGGKEVYAILQLLSEEMWDGIIGEL